MGDLLFSATNGIGAELLPKASDPQYAGNVRAALRRLDRAEAEVERLRAVLQTLARLGQALTTLKTQPIDVVKDGSGFTSVTMPDNVADELHAVVASADALAAQLYAAYATEGMQT